MYTRNLQLNDLHAVEILGRSLFREVDEIPDLLKALRSYLPELSFVLVEDNKILGFTLVCRKMTNVYYSFMGSIPNCYELAFLGISPECQGKGCGLRLLKETLQAISQQSKEFTCWLIVDVANKPAQRLYEKFGFRRWVQTDADITPIPGYIMGLSHRRFCTDAKRIINHTPLLTIHVC
jgi:ribosomal protein S18 acetylase RimI-like enzyme